MAAVLAGERRLGHFGLTVQDFEDLAPVVRGEVIPLERPKRGRGRPRKSLGSALAEDVASGQAAPTLAEMAFLRAQLQGIPIAAAADRYLGLEEKVDARSLQAMGRRLMVRILKRAQQLSDADDVLAAVVELDALLPEETPPAPAAAPSGPQLPSLEQFALERGAEEFSEAELLEMYADEFGVEPMANPPAPAAAPSPVVQVPVGAKERDQALVRKLDALAWLVPRMARAPLPDALLGEWFKPEIKEALQRQGLRTLADLVGWINRCGRRWFDDVPGLGRARAHRVVAWLWAHAEHLRVRPDARILQGLPFPTIPLVVDQAWRALSESAVADRAVASTGRFDLSRPTERRTGIVPIEYFAWPADLDGASGPFRKVEKNHLEAHNDPQAVTNWLNTVVGHKSLNTQRLYRIAVERLILWALVARIPEPRALADLVPADLQAFSKFLAEPPTSWVQPKPTPRSSPDWRPLRGPLDPATVRNTLAAVQSMYKAWWTMGYLSGDPTTQMGKPDGGRPHIDVMRSFSKQDIAAIERTYAELPAGPAKNRLQAIILLFQGAGVRAAEPTAGNWGDVTPLRIGNETSTQYQLRVVGKGGKVRFIPLRADAMEALLLHYEDRRQLAAAGTIPPLVDRAVDEAYARRYGWKDAEAYSDGRQSLPPRPDGLPPASVPLLGVLRRGRTPAGVVSVPWGAQESGPAAEQRRAVNLQRARGLKERAQDLQGRLSVDSLYGDLKGFFNLVGQREDLEAGAANFSKASAHWLRHTFAHQALAATQGDAGLPVVQQLLGHASVTTTGIYTKADMAQRTAAVNAMPAWGMDVEVEDAAMAVEEQDTEKAAVGAWGADAAVLAAHEALGQEARDLPWTSNSAGEVFMQDGSPDGVRIGHFQGAALAEFVVKAHAAVLAVTSELQQGHQPSVNKEASCCSRF